MLAAADKNLELGFYTVYDTMEALYLGASDTLTTTMRWLVLYLSDNPDLVDQILAEVEKSIEENGRASQDDCHLIRV